MSNGVDLYRQFLTLHQNQLQTSVVPEHLWPTLFKKLVEGVFDAGSTFSLMQVEEEEETSWKVVVISEEGVNCGDSEQIYLVDHAWTFRPEDARLQLQQHPGLLERMANLFDLSIEDIEKDDLIDQVMDAKWKFASTYSVGSAATIEERMPVWYLMDEFGSRIQHSDDFNFRLVPFMYIPEGCAYSLLFPVKDVKHQEEITRDFLEGPEAQDKLTRLALLNIWNHIDLTEFSDWKQTEPEVEFFASSRSNETLPDENFEAKELPKDRKIKVYAEYAFIGPNLTHERFEMVESPEEADIVWYTWHYKQFKEFSEETPHKRINQFPFEHVLTIKDLLCIVCRRMRKNNENEPKWLPTTFNMKTELDKFVSYFQSRQEKGLDNHWIVKPWNLARALDTHVSKSLPHILKQVITGPKIVQKYLHDPVCFERPEIGQVKFDIRYIILLRSTKPLKVYAYNRFWLRFANQKFELKDLDVYEKHFTVMNYSESSHLEQMFCHDFIKKFEEQYPGFKWDKIELDIFSMLKEVFQGACQLAPPSGIAHSPQSRSMYAVDLMLKWNPDHTEMIPQMLEVNWGPDCKRACDYYPEYFNDVFSTLYLDEPQNSTLL